MSPITLVGVTPRHDALLDPVSGVHDLIDGYRWTQTVCAAARLGIPGLLAGGPLILDEIAAECDVPADEMERRMRALVGLEVCGVGPEGYRTTALGRVLESTDPGGAHVRAMMTADLLYPMWSDLTDRLCRGTGGPTTSCGLAAVVRGHGPRRTCSTSARSPTVAVSPSWRPPTRSRTEPLPQASGNSRRRW